MLRADRDRLREEREVGEMQLAACMAAALGNTPETAAERIGPGHPYYSASYGDVCRAVDREMKLREEIAAKDAEIQRLKDALGRLVGSTDRAELEQMAVVMRSLPAPVEDIAASLNAIEVLLAAPADKGKTCAPMEDWRGANEDWRKR
jgi:hypothetical protein